MADTHATHPESQPSKLTEVNLILLQFQNTRDEIRNYNVKMASLCDEALYYIQDFHERKCSLRPDLLCVCPLRTEILTELRRKACDEPGGAAFQYFNEEGKYAFGLVSSFAIVLWI